MQSSLLGPLDLLGANVKYLILVLALANAGTRAAAHRQHQQQAAASDDAEEMTRHTLHEATTFALVLASLYFATIDLNGGTVMSMLAIGLLITDFFEFEARKVEARKGDPLERPKGALFASLLVLGYAAFQALFFLFRGIVSQIIVL